MTLALHLVPSTGLESGGLVGGERECCCGGGGWGGAVVIETDEGGSRWMNAWMFTSSLVVQSEHPVRTAHTLTHALPRRGRVRVTRHTARLRWNRWIHAQTHSPMSQQCWQGPDLCRRGRSLGRHMERGL